MDLNVVTVCIILIYMKVAVNATNSTKSQPHILFIVADDLGWNDVAWNNPGMKMPTLDKLARKGVILNSSYVLPSCSPSRGAMMTGYYPFHMGMQRGVISKFNPRFMPADKETLPEALRKLGYSTHMIGKWHLGFCNWKYTPTQRGFDSFYGFYSGAGDYYKHTLGTIINIRSTSCENGPLDIFERGNILISNRVSNAVVDGGYDFRFNTSVHYPPKLRYSTTLFGRRAVDIIKNHNPNDKPLYLHLAFQGVHSPLQVPRQYYQMQSDDVQNKNRRIYKGMVSALDAAVGRVMTEFKRKGLIDNLLVVFTSDNGGASYIAGSNWPLRGSKTTLWEGGTRVPTFVYSKTLIKKSHRVYNGLFHATDWYPTLVRLAHGTTSPFIDGVDQWSGLSMAWPSPRTEFVYNINEVKRSGALRMGDYKLIVGSPGRYNSWYPERTQPSCKQLKREGYRYQKEEKLLRMTERADRRSSLRNKSAWWFSSPLSYVKSLAQNAADRTGATRMWNRVSHLYKRYTCDKFNYAYKYEAKHLKTSSIHLFNIRDDPLEKNNLAYKKPVMTKKMIKKLKHYKKSLVPSQKSPPTKAAHPKYHNGVWSPGWC